MSLGPSDGDFGDCLFLGLPINRIGIGFIDTF